ncbi:hypothetical protein LJC43_04465 [Parabacteroides sp. OttesenSCG-928-G21]|nr:hypothetical protein [Parabacteroides sp. OttesenSCG-928-G21]
MERKKISLSGLGEVLTPQEMKNITGGSVICSCTCDGTLITGTCAGSSPDECRGYSCAGCDSTPNDCWYA